jgi:hypothetical protein
MQAQLVVVPVGRRIEDVPDGVDAAEYREHRVGVSGIESVAPGG